jgi:hypothetical protein
MKMVNPRAGRDFPTIIRMGGWLTAGAVVLAWLLALAVASIVRVMRAKAALGAAHDSLADALRERHSASLDLMSALSAADTPTDLADRVFEARSALDLPEGVGALEQAAAERALDVAIRDVSDQIAEHPALRDDQAVETAYQALLRAQDRLKDGERAYDTATREVARLSASWPTRWFTNH